MGSTICNFFSQFFFQRERAFYVLSILYNLQEILAFEHSTDLIATPAQIRFIFSCNLHRSKTLFNTHVL